MSEWHSCSCVGEEEEGGKKQERWILSRLCRILYPWRRCRPRSPWWPTAPSLSSQCRVNLRANCLIHVITIQGILKRSDKQDFKPTRQNIMTMGKDLSSNFYWCRKTSIECLFWPLFKTLKDILQYSSAVSVWNKGYNVNMEPSVMNVGRIHTASR